VNDQHETKSCVVGLWPPRPYPRPAAWPHAWPGTRSHVRSAIRTNAGSGTWSDAASASDS
jgi:hypothetical protein